jgi:hypothetical protein
MVDYPHHPETTDERDEPQQAATPLKTYALIAIGVVLVLAMLGLHLAGVLGPGAH